MLINTLFIYEESDAHLFDIVSINNILNDLFLKNPELKISHFVGCALQRFTYSQFRKRYSKTSDFDVVIFLIDQQSWQLDTLYEIGLLTALKQPKIIIASAAAKKEIKRKNDDIIVCDNFAEFFKNDEFLNEFINILLEITRQFSYVGTFFSKVWFPVDTKNITIIASPEFEPPIDGELTSHNFDFLDTVGDKDTILEVFGLLSRKCPQANIEIICASNNRISTKQNIVIIGGPGGPDYIRADGSTIDATGNIVCRRISDRIKSRISYSSDCEYMIYEKNNYSASYDDMGIMTEDYGYFASIRNPYDEKFRVVLLHGIHTLGVVGAARLFSDETNSEINYKILIEEFVGCNIEDISFECFFNVDINYGTVLTPPTISRENIITIGKELPKLSKPISMTTTEDSELNELINDIEVLSKEISEKLSSAIGDKYTPQKRERLSALMKRISLLLENRTSLGKEELHKKYSSILKDFQG